MRDHQFTGSGFGFEQALEFIARPDSIALTETLARRFESQARRFHRSEYQ